MAPLRMMLFVVYRTGGRITDPRVPKQHTASKLTYGIVTPKAILMSTRLRFGTLGSTILSSVKGCPLPTVCMASSPDADWADVVNTLRALFRCCRCSHHAPRGTFEMTHHRSQPLKWRIMKRCRKHKNKCGKPNRAGTATLPADFF